MKRCKIILQDMLMVWEVGELSRRKRKRLVRQEKQRLKEYYRFQHLNTRNEKITFLKDNIVYVEPTIGLPCRELRRFIEAGRCFSVNFQQKQNG